MLRRPNGVISMSMVSEILLMAALTAQYMLRAMAGLESSMASDKIKAKEKTTHCQPHREPIQITMPDFCFRRYGRNARATLRPPNTLTLKLVEFSLCFLIKDAYELELVISRFWAVQTVREI